MSGPDISPTSGASSCYRHGDKHTGVRCQRCDRYICSQCMHQASVGVHCPECTSNNKQKVYTPSTLPGAGSPVTQTLIGLNLVVFVLQFALWDATLQDDGRTALELATYAPNIADGEWWRIITSGFGHFGVFHLGMNMYSLYILGPLLERSLGSRRFALAYFASLIGGSLGAIVESPRALSMGASGAIFGLLGLLVMLYRSRGISINQSGLGPVLLLNLFISLSGFVSLGGHAGGFIVGIGLGAMYFGANVRSGPLFGRDQTKPEIATIAVAVVLFVAAILLAGLSPGGIIP